MTDDLDRELRTHLELEAEEQRDAGLDAEDARYAAMRALGNQAHIKEDVRALSPVAAIDDFFQDLRYGFRMLRKHPGFTFVAALTLALGIGANTAMFSVVDAVLLQPLPYPQADRLTMVWENVNLPAYKNDQNTPAPGNFNDWRQSAAFSGMAAIGGRAWNLTGAGDPLRLQGDAVSANFFSVLGVDVAFGRTFTMEEDQPGGPKVAVLGHGLWSDRFGSDPTIVGRKILLDDTPYTVVGVMPRGFAFPDPEDRLWIPIGLTPQQLANHGSHFLRVVARLKPGATLAQAQAELDGIAARLTQQFPASNTGVGVRVMSLREQTVGDVQTELLLLLGLVGFVLLMVCANIGNLLLARASAREREFAVRAALGAGRGRVLRQLLTESVLLAVLGGVAGLVLASWGISGLRWLAPVSLPQATDLSINSKAGLFNFAIACVAGVVCGLAPAWHADRKDLHGAIKAEARVSSHGSGRRARNMLVVAETALGVVVLIGAGLLLRSFWHLQHVAVGFESDRVLTFRVALPATRYGTLQKRTAFYQQLAERLGAAPGIQAAAGISFLPLSFAGRSTGVNVEGDPPPAPGEVKFVDFRSVTPGYFSTLRIPLVAGRDVAWSDAPDSPQVIVISEATARAFWPSGNALGRRLKLGPSNDPSIPWLSVVGIVGNVQQLDLVRRPRPAIYLAGTQDPGTGDTVRDWVVRTAPDPATLAATARAAVWGIDGALPVTRLQPMDRVRSGATAREQFTLLLVALFAALALVLAAVGLYGVTAYAVTQRTHELGIRLALGARPADVLRIVLGQGARLVLAGLAIGIVASLALTQLMATLLFGIGTRDPVTFAAVGLILAAVSLLACYIPARRAMRVDPVVALRS
jgi:putative ABC transport system permease protein